MKVLVTQNSRSFGDNPQTHYAGDEVELPDDVAKELIASGNAEAANEKSADELKPSEVASDNALASGSAKNEAEAVDLGRVVGTGADGRILKSDVEASRQSSEP